MFFILRAYETRGILLVIAAILIIIFIRKCSKTQNKLIIVSGWLVGCQTDDNYHFIVVVSSEFSV